MALKPFKNEPPTDFSKPVNRKAMEKALAKVKVILGKGIRLLSVVKKFSLMIN